MFNSDLRLSMGAPRMMFEADTGAGGSGSTILTGEQTGDGGTGAGASGDGGSNGNGGDGGGGSFGNWRDQVSDDLKGHDLIKNMGDKTLSDFVRDHIDIQGKADKATPLPKDATDAQRAEWLRTRTTEAGFVIPEDVAGYEIGKPDIPDGMYYDDKAVDTFLQNALKLGLSKNVVQELVKANDDAAVALHIQDKADALKAHTERVDAMKTEYGDKFKEVAENSHRAVEAFGSAEFQTLLDTTTFDGKRLGDHPDVIATFNNIANAIGEDKMGQWKGGGASGKKGPKVDQYGNPIPDFSKSMGDGS